MNEQINGAAKLDALPDDARMDAYYYSFDRTGVGPVDAILSAVAVAGKGSHHTDGWRDVSDYYYKERPGLPDADSGMDLIQLTANQSADQIRAALSPDQPQRVQPSREDVADGLIQARSSGMCRFGKVCDLCDCGLEGHTDDEARRADSRTLIEADAVLALFAQQPTVAEVKAEAWDEGWIAASAYRAAGKVQDGYFVGAYAQPLNPYRADRIEREARP